MTNATTQLDRMPAPVWNSPEPPAVPLRPLRIGPLEIGFPAVQAALSGYSDGAMRTVARRLGAPYTLAEVLIDRFILELKNRRKTQHYLQIADEEHPVGGQLMGSNPADFGPAAQKLVAAGFDVIDINFGCPVKSAVGGCRGGYHLGQPDLALEIVDRVRLAVPSQIPVTLKMRRGIDDTAESRDRFFTILDGAFERGVAAITVHARTVGQKYVGPSNWEFLRQVKSHVGQRTILGSGDLFTAQACLDMLRRTGVDGVSVARGAIGNPWIFQQIRDLIEGKSPTVPDVAEQRRVLQMHCELSVQATNPSAASSTMRAFGLKFARLHPNPEEVRNAFAAAHCLNDWNAVIERWY
ncbi:MAG: tRNA-dihydrouridine synthase [Planctomycetes bacterium]|nr:tRNA-dihydrouridine synthase [Planctomycetota bacterium]